MGGDWGSDMKKQLILLLFLLYAIGAEKPSIVVVTEDFKPFNYVDSTGQVTGPTTKLIQQILDSCGYEGQEIMVYPWARAYNMALDQKNVLIYSMVRTLQRDTLFSWIGEVGKITMGAMKLRSRTDIVVDKTDDLRNYRIATFIDSPFDSYFKAQGIPVSHRVGNYKSTINLLVEGRVDMVPASIEGYLSTAEKAGYPRELFDVAVRIPELEKGLWVAFSKKTDDSLVVQFREAYENLVE